MKGYKAFDKNLKCRNFQYEIGETYEIELKPILCQRGFHFCKTIADCYSFYEMSDNTRICEIEALGDIISDDGKVKYCTNKIKIVAEITGDEKRCNINNLSTGYFNTGLNNYGNYNTGDCNTGYYNTGDFNSGYYNTGDYNNGDYNSGDYNNGDYNTGRHNTGDYNTGRHNTGDYNVGRHNTGNYNTGYYNTGDYNSGNYNTGGYNTGDYNIGNYNVGLFNTEMNPKIKIFDKDSDWTIIDWNSSLAKRILSGMPRDYIKSTDYANMSDEEKQNHPEVKVDMTCNILVKTTDEDRQKWWDNLSENEKKEVFNIPNFDPYIFYQCTGIKIDFSSIINGESNE